MSSADGVFYDAMLKRGKRYLVSNPIAGVAYTNAFSTAPALSIWNPPASGVNCAIKKVKVFKVSGTFGIGAFYNSYIAQVVAPTGGTELTPVDAALQVNTRIVRCFSGSTISGIPAIISGISNIFDNGTTISPEAQDAEELSQIVIPPGFVWSIQAISAAVVAPVIIVSVAYQEVYP